MCGSDHPRWCLVTVLPVLCGGGAITSVSVSCAMDRFNICMLHPHLTRGEKIQSSVVIKEIMSGTLLVSQSWVKGSSELV